MGAEKKRSGMWTRVRRRGWETGQWACTVGGRSSGRGYEGDGVGEVEKKMRDGDEEAGGK